MDKLFFDPSLRMMLLRTDVYCVVNCEKKLKFIYLLKT